MRGHDEIRLRHMLEAAREAVSFALVAYDAANSPASLSAPTTTPNCGSPATIATVSRLTLITWPKKRHCVLRSGRYGIRITEYAMLYDDDPFERGTVAEAGSEGGGGDAIEGELM